MSSVVKEQYNHKADIEETDRIQQISDSHNPRTLLRLAQASNCLRNTTSWRGPCAPATTAHARGEGGRDCDPYPAPRAAMSRSWGAPSHFGSTMHQSSLWSNVGQRGIRDRHKRHQDDETMNHRSQRVRVDREVRRWEEQRFRRMSERMNNLLRHGRNRRFVPVDEDGFSRLSNVFNDRDMMSENATEQDCLTTIERNDKVRFEVIRAHPSASMEERERISERTLARAQGSVESARSQEEKNVIRVRAAHAEGAAGSVWFIRVCQGWSSGSGVVSANALKEALMGDPDWVEHVVHGTFGALVPNILTEGLVAGGGERHWRNNSFRNHVHFATQIEDTGKTPGVRSRTDALVYVDVRDYYNRGGRMFKSQNGAFLTEGLNATDDVPGVVPAVCITRVLDRYSGDVLYDRDESIPADVRLRQEEADRKAAEEGETEAIYITDADMDAMLARDEDSLGPDLMQVWLKKTEEPRGSGGRGESSLPAPGAGSSAGPSQSTGPRDVGAMDVSAAEGEPAAALPAEVPQALSVPSSMPSLVPISMDDDEIPEVTGSAEEDMQSPEMKWYRTGEQQPELLAIAQERLQERNDENKRFVVIERGPHRRSIGLQVEEFWNGLRTNGLPGRFIGMTVAKTAGAAIEAGLKEGDLIVLINGVHGSAEKMCDEALKSQTVVFELQSKDKYREPVRKVAGYLLRPGMPSEFPFEQMLEDRKEASLTKGYPYPKDAGCRRARSEWLAPDGAASGACGCCMGAEEPRVERDAGIGCWTGQVDAWDLQLDCT